MAATIDKTPIENAKSLIATEGSDFKQLAKDGIADMEAEITRIVTKYSDPNTYKTIVQDIIDDAYAQIQSAYVALSTMIANTYASVVSQIATISAVFTGIGSGIIGFASQINSLGQVIKLVKLVQSIIKFVTQTVANIIDQVTSLVNNIISTAVNVGKGILETIEGAITDVIDDVLKGPAAIIDEHLKKMTERADELMKKSTDAETLIEELTGRKPGEEDFITSIEAFGGKLPEDQDKHGIAVDVTTQVGTLVG